MVFSSLIFLLFFFTALFICYFCIPKRLRWLRNCMLLAYSLFFYRCGGADYLPLLLASILVNYLGGLLAASGRPALRKLGLWGAVALGLGLLGWFKYAGFVAENLNALGMPVGAPKIVLPIGISFFTFQGLSYVIDVYRGDAKCQKNPLYVALYVALFPQLVAGPIVRYTTVEEEITRREESLHEFSQGVVRFLFGLGKKMLLANAMGEIADGVFAQAPETMAAALAWVGALAYTLQIYFDFSAYSDMAIGLGRMFGFHFRELQLSLHLPLGNRVLAAVAYLSQFLVSRLCVHSFGRQPLFSGPECSKPGGGVAADRLVAWGGLEFCSLGRLVPDPAAGGEVPVGQSPGPGPRFSGLAVYHAGGGFWVGAVPFRQS